MKKFLVAQVVPKCVFVGKSKLPAMPQRSVEDHILVVQHLAELGHVVCGWDLTQYIARVVIPNYGEAMIGLPIALLNSRIPSQSRAVQRLEEIKLLTHDEVREKMTQEYRGLPRRVVELLEGGAPIGEALLRGFGDADSFLESYFAPAVRAVIEALRDARNGDVVYTCGDVVYVATVIVGVFRSMGQLSNSASICSQFKQLLQARELLSYSHAVVVDMNSDSVGEGPKVHFVRP